MEVYALKQTHLLDLNWCTENKHRERHKKLYCFAKVTVLEAYAFESVHSYETYTAEWK